MFFFFIDQFDLPRYTSSHVTHITGCTKDDLKNWVKRGFLYTELAAVTQGKGRLYTKNNIYEIALITLLRRSGMSFNAIAKCVQFVSKCNPKQLAFDFIKEEAREVDLKETVEDILTYQNMAGEVNLTAHATVIIDVDSLKTRIDRLIVEKDPGATGVLLS